MKKKLVEVEPGVVIDVVSTPKVTNESISEISSLFSNGDDNLLRDKINEIIRHING